jgi:hypothetical protein
MRHRLALVAPAVLLWTLAARAAVASPEIDAIDYSAPTACIDGPTFRARLAALPGLPGAVARPDHVTVRILESDGGFAGEVAVVHTDGAHTERKVVGESCDEVVLALELVTALALGLEAPTTHQPPPAPPKPAPPAPAPVPVGAPAPVRARWRFTAALRASLVTGFSGGGTSGVLVAPEAALGVTLDSPGVVAPSFEISGSWTETGSLHTVDGSVTVSAGFPGLTACPIRVPIGAGLGLRPCLLVSAGELAATSGTSTKQEPAFAVSPLARLEWRLGRFLLEADGGASFRPHTQFYFTPGPVVAYDASVVGGIAHAGAAVLFP